MDQWEEKKTFVGSITRKEMMYEIVKPTRGFEMNMIYPQYAENYSQEEYAENYSQEDIISMDTWAQIQQWAQKRLNDETFKPNDEVHRHMILIINGFVPYDMRITSESL